MWLTFSASYSLFPSHTMIFRYGGEDGGYAGKKRSHVFGSYFSESRPLVRKNMPSSPLTFCSMIFADDLWRLSLPSGPWKKIQAADRSAVWPRTGRASHGMSAVNGFIYVFGGHTSNTTDETSSDHLWNTAELWKFDPDATTWAKMPSAASMARHGASLVSLGTQIWLFGGAQLKGKELSDLWFYELDGLKKATSAWSEIQTVNAPHSRAYHGFAHFPGTTQLFVTGGAHCAGSCRCFDDTMVFDVNATQPKWIQLQVEQQPTSRYHHTMVAADASVSASKKESVTLWSVITLLACWLNQMMGPIEAEQAAPALYMFGGESYSPKYMYHNDVVVLLRKTIDRQDMKQVKHDDM